MSGPSTTVRCRWCSTSCSPTPQRAGSRRWQRRRVPRRPVPQARSTARGARLLQEDPVETSGATSRSTSLLRGRRRGGRRARGGRPGGVRLGLAPHRGAAPPPRLPGRAQALRRAHRRRILLDNGPSSNTLRGPPDGARRRPAPHRQAIVRVTRVGFGREAARIPEPSAPGRTVPARHRHPVVAAGHGSGALSTLAHRTDLEGAAGRPGVHDLTDTGCMAPDGPTPPTPRRHRRPHARGAAHHQTSGHHRRHRRRGLLRRFRGPPMRLLAGLLDRVASDSRKRPADKARTA